MNKFTFSDTHTAIPSIGGLISETLEGFPCTKAAVGEKKWILTYLNNQYLAMTYAEARALNLKEYFWPQSSTQDRKYAAGPHDMAADSAPSIEKKQPHLK